MTGAGTPVGYGGYYPPTTYGGSSMAQAFTSMSSYDPVVIAAMQNMNLGQN